MYAKDYVFPLALTAAWRADLQSRTQTQLSEMLGVEVDTVMAEYVLVMVGNKKSMAQIAHDLIDFIGDESAEHFVAWLSGVLPTYEAQAAGDDAAPTASATETETRTTAVTITPTSEAAASAPETTAPAPEATPGKRIISLKSSSASTDAAPKLVSLSASRGTVRSLSRAPAPSDDVLAKRSQRFGIVEKSPPPPSRKAGRGDDAPKALVSSAGAAKRKASAEPESSTRRGSGGRLSQLLGPPVNVDQAELDARDSLHSNKKTKPNPRTGTEPERERRSRSNGRNDRNDRTNQENRDADSTNRKLTRRAEPSERPLRQGDAPPLPRSDRPERGDKFGGRGNQQGGYFNGPPGFGGFPPPPYGHPMYFPPPPFGQMPPYGMGFPPPHGGPGYYDGPGAYGGRHGPAMPGGRGPRAGFQNRTWVNPNVAKADDAKAEGGDGDATAAAGGAEGSASSSTAGGLNPSAPAFAPRNPFFSSQMRPRFQNKTWVRQDPAKDEELSLTLPTTPPPDGADAAE